LTVSMCLTWTSALWATEYLSEAQKEELRRYGDITVVAEDGSTEMYHVRFVPGTEPVKHFARTCREEGMEIVRDTFQPENLGWCATYVLDGLRGMGLCFKTAGASIAEDFRGAVAAVNHTQGGPATKAVAGAYCGAKFSGSLLWKSMGALFGSAWGAVCAVGVPVVNLVGRPLWGGAIAVGGGFALPMVIHPWTRVAALVKSWDKAPKGADALITKYSPSEMNYRLSWREYLGTVDA
ncbi:MAG: hypothetical protein OXT67_10230, partial [Zetaproteobacteria bacterium]|nr:hypothetical protein [Zetaproteobacteria bacterium]